VSQYPTWENGDWDIDTDCVSSVNQGPCWDAGDMHSWGKSPGRAETSPPGTSSPIHWKSRQAITPMPPPSGGLPGLCHTGVPGFHPAKQPGCHSLACQAYQAVTPLALQNHQVSALWPAKLPTHQAATQKPAQPCPDCQPRGIPAAIHHRRAPTPPDASSKPA
jgi:hypothetical protein